MPFRLLFYYFLVKSGVQNLYYSITSNLINLSHIIIIIFILLLILLLYNKQSQHNMQKGVGRREKQTTKKYKVFKAQKRKSFFQINKEFCLSSTFIFRGD